MCSAPLTLRMGQPHVEVWEEGLPRPITTSSAVNSEGAGLVKNKFREIKVCWPEIRSSPASACSQHGHHLARLVPTVGPSHQGGQEVKKVWAPG